MQQRKKDRERYRIKAKSTTFDTEINMTEKCKVLDEKGTRGGYTLTQLDLTTSSNKSIRLGSIHEWTGVFGVFDSTGI